MTQLAGHAAALGISPASVLRADIVERPLMWEALAIAYDIQFERDKRLATLIVNEYAHARR